MIALTVVVAVAVGAGCAYGDGSPRIIQTYTHGAPPYDIAVSPSGAKMCIVSYRRVREHRLDDEGRIGGDTHDLGLHEGYKCAYLSGGRQIIIAGLTGSITSVRRSDWTTTSLASPLVGTPEDIFMPRNERVCYIQSNATGDVLVLGYSRGQPEIEQVLELEGQWFGRGVCGTDDARYMFQMGGGQLDADASLLVRRNDPRTYGGIEWREEMLQRPRALCMGPGPDHLCVVQEGNDTVKVYQWREPGLQGNVAVGFHDPLAVETWREDGYYGVVLCPGRLVVFCGEDLRACTEENYRPGISPMRKADVAVGAQVTGMCLHPDLPIAYVWSWQGKDVQVVELHIPGVPEPEL